jgi:hypothetical protein
MLSEAEKDKVQRFIARHHRPILEDIERAVAPYRGMSPEDTWRAVDSVCRDAAFLLAAHPDRDRILVERDPPHPSYAGIMKRLRRGHAS